MTASSILMTSMFDKAGIFVEQSNLAVGHFQVSSLILQLCCFRSLCKYPLRLQRKRSRLVASLKNSLLVSYFLDANTSPLKFFAIYNVGKKVKKW